jgi:hypothetical protein
MKPSRIWIEIIAPCIAVACVLALGIAFLGAVVYALEETPESAQAAEPPASPQQSYEGMVSDSQCGAKHSAAIGKAASDCARVCVHGGSQFALIDGDKMYLLEGESAALKRLAGQRVKVTGTLTGNTIAVFSVST